MSIAGQGCVPCAALGAGKQVESSPRHGLSPRRPQGPVAPTSGPLPFRTPLSPGPSSAQMFAVQSIGHEASTPLALDCCVPNLASLPESVLSWVHLGGGATLPERGLRKVFNSAETPSLRCTPPKAGNSCGGVEHLLRPADRPQIARAPWPPDPNRKHAHSILACPLTRQGPGALKQGPAEGKRATYTRTRANPHASTASC